MAMKKKKTSIMLTARDKKLLELLAKKENRSQTAEIEYLIRQRAEELKIEEP
jgi:flagellar basal body-associated protein FliL